jgi:hypothetical protein
MNCRYGRKFGQDIETARNAASTHVNKFNTHKVKILRGETEREIITGQVESLLPADSMVPADRLGLLAASRTNQRILRKLTYRD